jgi:hypothetical protein
MGYQQRRLGARRWFLHARRHLFVILQIGPHWLLLLLCLVVVLRGLVPVEQTEKVARGERTRDAEIKACQRKQPGTRHSPQAHHLGLAPNFDTATRIRYRGSWGVARIYKHEQSLHHPPHPRAVSCTVHTSSIISVPHIEVQVYVQA